MQITMMGVDVLTPNPHNTRTHDATQIAQLVASIREFGFTKPILVDEAGVILAGHGAVLAAQALRLDRVPVLVLTHLTDEQKRAYLIADNKIGLNSDWSDALGTELRSLNVAHFGRALGFSAWELKTLTGKELQPAASDGLQSITPTNASVRVLCEPAHKGSIAARVREALADCEGFIRVET